MEVKASKRMRKDVDVLVVDHPDPFVHRVPEEVLEGNIRGTEETSLGIEGNAVLRLSGPTFQGLIYVFSQRGGVDERDRGLLHAEEAMLDISTTYGTDPIPLRKRTL